ncbi:CoA transferase subunit A [Polaribacter sp.]|uniref:CoA transferase subunit A n=1 Tax=Polaribacter sp. TaxID=1920175 RepID=UPI003F6C89B3
MTEFLSLEKAIQKYVKPKTSVALEGFTHLIPHAAGLEIIRQKINDLHLFRMTPDIIYDQLIGMGCVSKLTFSWGGNPGVGSLHRFRDAYENEFPNKIEFKEHAHSAMANAYAAGASGLPCAIFKGYLGTSYPDINDDIKFMKCPFSEEKLTIIPSIRPDIGIIHAQKADKNGNIWIKGISGSQKEVLMASKKTIVTVEEIVDIIDEKNGGTIIPRWVINAICVEPNGAFPSYAEGYYNRYNAFYKEWDTISKDRKTFNNWINKFVLSTKNYTEFFKKINNEE